MIRRSDIQEAFADKSFMSIDETDRYGAKARDLIAIAWGIKPDQVNQWVLNKSYFMDEYIKCTRMLLRILTSNSPLELQRKVMGDANSFLKNYVYTILKNNPKYIQ